MSFKERRLPIYAIARALRTRPSHLAQRLALVFGLLLTASVAHAQAMPDMTRSASIGVFGAYTYSKPDYGQDYQNNNGGTVGVDFTRYIGHHIEPALEVRAYDAHGPVVNQKAVMGGLRVGTTYRRRFHPYGDIMAGVFTIHYVFPPYPGYVSDRGLDIVGGAGIDVDVYRNFALKADFQYQHVNLGQDFTLTPTLFSLGVRYTIPFAPRVHQRYYR